MTTRDLVNNVMAQTRHITSGTQHRQYSTFPARQEAHPVHAASAEAIQRHATIQLACDSPAFAEKGCSGLCEANNINYRKWIACVEEFGKGDHSVCQTAARNLDASRDALWFCLGIE